MRRLPLSTIVAAVLLVHAPLARAGQVFVDVGGATLRFTPANVSVLDHGDIIVWHWLQSRLMTLPSELTCWPSWHRKHPG